MPKNQVKYTFLVGSAKSGTTKLADLLDLHPDITLSSDKEPDTFADSDFSETLLNDYNTLFDSAAKIRIDASTSYSERTDSELIAERLYRVDPLAKILYLVRDPAKRAWSSYWHYVRNGVEHRSPEEAITDINSPHYVGSCFYSQIRNYETVFPRSQIRIIEFEDFIKSPSAIYKEILAFLELDDAPLQQGESSKTTNKSYQWRGPATILKYVKPKYIQKATKIIKKTLPEGFINTIKHSATKPVPKITPAQYQKFAPLFEEERRALKREYTDLFISSTTD
jgi:hypothetical protein|tara:strand:+ start:5394 stop:6236 length:843 start_codon:yes stop_codon:yes gene_type:complete